MSLIPVSVADEERDKVTKTTRDNPADTGCVVYIRGVAEVQFIVAPPPYHHQHRSEYIK